MEKKRLALVGCGKLGVVIAQAWKDGLLEDYEFVGAASRTMESAQKVAAITGCKACETIDELLELKPDFVAEAENRNTHKVYEKDKIGEVQIADEVVAIIAGLAATEVDGVDSMAGNITNELVGKLGMKNLSKGVKVDVTEEHVSVDLSLNMKYGYNIPDVSEKVQDRVKTAIENMTGLHVLDVNIKIASVNMEAEEQ